MEGSSAEDLECQVRKDFRSACCGNVDCEYEGKRYCILHLPIENKGDDFKQALQSKFERNNFEFTGVYFPRDFNDFREDTFSEEANFYGGTFSERANFSKANFSKRANFSEANFSEGAFFREAPSVEWRTSKEPSSAGRCGQNMSSAKGVLKR